MNEDKESEEWIAFYKNQNITILKKIREIVSKIKNVKQTDILNLTTEELLAEIEKYVENKSK